MIFRGLWLVCDDSTVRPVIRGEVLAANGDWVKVPFLLDTGADRTVFSANVWQALGQEGTAPTHGLTGAGGAVASVVLNTALRLPVEPAGAATFRGQFASFTSQDALDISVLGRDITDMFGVIIDRQHDVVCMLGQGHTYTIVTR